MSVVAEKKKKKKVLNVVILKELKVLAVRERDGWEKVISIVEWFKKDPQFDIRYWSPDRTEASRGITIEYAEMVDLIGALSVKDVDLLISEFKLS